MASAAIGTLKVVTIASRSWESLNTRDHDTAPIDADRNGANVGPLLDSMSPCEDLNDLI